MIKLEEISGIEEWTETERKEGEETDLIYTVRGGEKAFLVVRPKTIEVRCEGNLGRKLREEYETVMASRYFGRGGIEIVPSGQLSDAEIDDLVRLSYNLTKEME